MLGKLSVPGRPTSLDDSRARAYCACSRCGWGLFGHFFPHLSFLFSFSLSLGDGPIWTEILSQRAVKPKTTNQSFPFGYKGGMWDFIVLVHDHSFSFYFLSTRPSSAH